MALQCVIKTELTQLMFLFFPIFLNHPLDQVDQDPIQPDLEYLEGWGNHNFSEQAFPVPHHPLSKTFTWYKFSLFKFVRSCHITNCPCKKSVSFFFFIVSLQVLKGHIRSPQSIFWLFSRFVCYDLVEIIIWFHNRMTLRNKMELQDFWKFFNSAAVIAGGLRGF